MVVALAAATTSQQDNPFAIFHNFAYNLVRLRIFGYRSQRNFNDDIFAIGAGTALPATGAAMSGTQMTLITQVQKCPHLGITDHNYITAFTAIATIGTSPGDIFFASEMHRTSTTVARKAKNLYIINKIG
jgi:hypothetical protein